MLKPGNGFLVRSIKYNNNGVQYFLLAKLLSSSSHQLCLLARVYHDRPCGLVVFF